MKKLVLFALISVSFLAQAQKEKMTLAAYEHAVDFSWSHLNNKKVFNLSTAVHWFEDGEGLWYIDYSKNGKVFSRIEFNDYTPGPFFDHKALAAALRDALGEDIKATDLPLTSLKKHGDSLDFLAQGQSFSWNLKNGELLFIDGPEEKEKVHEMASLSPKGNYRAYLNKHDIYLEDTNTTEEAALSTDGAIGYDYASYYGWFDEMEGENGERPQHFSVQWSPDEKWLATQAVDVRNAEKMYNLNYNIDSIFKPKVVSYFRGSPGDTTMVMVKPVVYNVETKKEVELNLPTNTHVNAVNIRFADDPQFIYASWADRGFKKQTVKKINLATGEEQLIWQETSPTSIDNFYFQPIPEWEKVVVFSEKSGWKQLYLVDENNGDIQALTHGEFVVNDIKHIDKQGKEIYYTASGVEAGVNPYLQKLYKVNLKGKVTLLTPEAGHHGIDFARDGKHFVDEISTVSTATETLLRKAKNGKKLATLTKADASQLMDAGWEAPETFSLMGKDGKTTIYGAFWKPINFDPNKKYPVIDATYTGPHTQRFPKTYREAFYNQSWAELGFIIVQIDGLGTAGRSKAFREVSYMNMGDNLRDHVEAIKYLGEKYAYVDVDRVGIYGHSAGGYDAGHALLAFPEFYKVGVASSGDHDFRMEKAWWPEMYMGYPVNEKYDAVSNISLAGNLKGKLLLVHGGMDHNVNPSGTYRLVEALVNAGKDFDLLILPSQRHGYTGKANTFFQKKRWNYFIEHLLDKESLWEYNID
ncbi:MAG: S9 family peptidase [Cytophagaceae bacterium]|nr:S9 family peptidase [Cytophagaceae bacterium]|tara:strand:- start:24374 stop:26632 length:2259 start_codon:yes stop_codon:yes gene_type:complete